MKTWELVFVALVVVLNLQLHVHGVPQVPCYFIFGDSLADNGNNNQLKSLARLNYLPYGIDFPGGPTGRFSNGKTTVDVIAQLLGFDDYIPPYVSASGQDILKGVNYASAAAGIRDETGQQLGGRISFSGHVKNYQNTVSQVVNLLGNEDSAADYLSKCIYSIGLGSNDYLNNYFMPKICTYMPTANFLSTTQLLGFDKLIPPFATANDSDILQGVNYASGAAGIRQETGNQLYHNGARKFALFGAGVVGFTPNSISLYGTKGKACVEEINTAVTLFNQQLISLVDNLTYVRLLGHM
ncbi:GDSL esterase/lipase At5g45670-like [Quercus robur]|uniref:GDSL esterase/lipase At5g45670-like n=1 Tax=Quercus robur TaxID=38942 RepID=UPI0021630648|nr:GDSL esterase/lipase At5g45670-like [Quercus robur]